MEPAKAVEILENDLITTELDCPLHVADALKLGIEALKRLLQMRSYNIGMAILPLKGENPIPDLSPSADKKKRLRESPIGRQ